MQAKDLKPGDTFWCHGYKWQATKVEFDPRGNTGTQPRYLVTADQIDTGSALPYAYAHSMVLGFLPDVEMTE